MYTVRDIFKKACSYISVKESEADELEAFAPIWLSALLAEALPYENAVRYTANTTQLTAAPNPQNMEDIVPYNEAICRIALPYGLAAQMFIDDDNIYLAQDFRARYISALGDALKAKEEKVRDEYA